VDEISGEDMFDAIKVFQTLYARRPDLVPRKPLRETDVVGITVESEDVDLEAFLQAEWEEEQDDPIRLHAQVGAREITVNRQPPNSVLHRRTIHLPGSTGTI
jgi:hypothetical protein